MTAATGGLRPEIQGLRAIAILGVMGFHTWPGAIPGGFAGVDVFFVISGYLITRTLMRDIEAGRHSLSGFYTRRVARLFPALILMLVAASITALIVLPPTQLIEFFASLSAASMFVANVHFGREVNYFAEAAELRPLLHTWSLAIEEQFYILYPLALLVLMKLAPGGRWKLLSLAGVLSLCYAILPDLLPLGVMPFYSPLTRAYELLIGCVLALRFDSSHRSKAIAAGEMVTGTALIAASFLLFAPGQEMPGWRALVPCLGCALLIDGSKGAPPALVAPLESPPARFFGDISYSLYLWHWPVLVFARLLALGDLGPVGLAACTGLSVLLAWLSYRYVERPVLARRWKPRFALAPTLVLLAIAALPRAPGLGDSGLPQRFSARSQAQFADRNDISPLRGRCHAAFDGPAAYADRCVLGAQVAPDTLLWSDSIGVELAYALAPEFRLAGRALRQATSSSCPPVLSDARFAGACLAFNRSVLTGLVGDTATTRVVLDAHYPGYRKLGLAGASGVEVAKEVVETARLLRGMASM